jgi:hypothetical protein
MDGGRPVTGGDWWESSADGSYPQFEPRDSFDRLIAAWPELPSVGAVG